MPPIGYTACAAACSAKRAGNTACTLPNTEHTLLYMRQVEQRSTEEMSRLLGLSPASVRTILSRARTRLLNDIRQHLNP